MAMARSSDTWRRAALISLRSDLVRGGVAVLLLIMLVAMRLPIAAALVFAIAGYVGTRLASVRFDPLADDVPAGRVSRSGRDALPRCSVIRADLIQMRHQIGNNDLGTQLDGLIARSGILAAAIDDDQRHDLAPTLLDLMETLAELMRPLARIMVRGAATPALIASVQRDLSTLAAAFDRLWDRVNAEAIADLAAASEMIEFSHDPDLPSLQDGGNR
jgi:hypothetical protein